ncbi:MAG: FAD-binding oxidoreductase [Pseudomonadota bacterium]
MSVAVIGAGAVGIATALALAERGEAPDVFDPEEPAAGASHGNAGVISPWSCVPVAMPGMWRQAPRWLMDPEGPLAVRPSYALRFLPWALKFLAAGRADRVERTADAMQALCRPSVEHYRRNLEGTGAEHLVVDTSYIYVARDRTALGLDGLSWAMRRARGAPLEVVEGEDLRRLEPALGPDYTAAAVLSGQARALDPGAVGRAIAAKAEGLGARFHRAAVEALTPGADGGWRLEIREGETRRSHQATRVVLAAGAWSARLLAPLGIRVPLEAERGYHVVLADPGVEVMNSVMETSGHFVSSSMAAGVRLAGTAEYAGIDAPPDWRRAEVLVRQARRLFPGINTASVTRWMGRRPSLPDSLPCIGPVPGQRGLIAAFGHSHWGFMQAPETGRLAAGLATGATPNIDLAPYAVERFA